MDLIFSPIRQARNYIPYTFQRNPIISTIIAVVTLFIFILIGFRARYYGPSKINGGWSDWENETECDKDCGDDSTRKQVRMCNNPMPSNKGQECKGESTRIVECDLPDCPIDGQWGKWVKTIPCTEECGPKGITIEERTCNNPKPQNGGVFCEGGPTRTVECNREKKCIEVVNGGWSDWVIGECKTKSENNCGAGKRLMTRECNNPSPKNGGTNCIGENSKELDCNLQDCIIDGGWSDWSITEKCSKDCGDGVKLWERECSNPKPKNGGKDCTGPTTKQEPTLKCNNKKCPLTEKECNSFGKGPYPKECLKKWFNDVTCTNDQYIKEYPEKGWWHSQPPEIVRQDMRNWALNPFWGDQFKSICLPKNYKPTNKRNCQLSNSHWDSDTQVCDTSKK